MPLATLPLGPIPLPVNRFTLPVIKNATNYLAARDLILYWLHRPGFFTARFDSALITDSMNALASQFWEGQIRTALKEGGDAWFLFKNTGSTYYDKGFEMLQVLEDHYHPSSISNTFTTLLSFSMTNRVIPRGSTSFVHALRGIFRAFLIHRSQFLRFSRSCSSCAPFTHAMRVSSISLLPSRRIFL